MERTKSKSQEQKIRWKKFGGGSFRTVHGKIIKPGQVFDAYPSEIPDAFRDTVRPLDALPEEEPIHAVQPTYTMKKRETSNFYDVFDSQGKQVNDKALTRIKANELIETLQ